MENVVVGSVVMRTSKGLIQRNPTEDRVRALVGALARGEHVVLEQFGRSSSYYIQVWLRPDGVFQLEYRAGSAGEHYQAQAESREKVAAALSGWIRGETAWRDDVEWLSIEDWFNQK
jgi:hypothetical protein